MMPSVARRAASEGRRRGPVSFLTDFGLRDTYVGQVKAVMLAICPGLSIVDLTHEVPAQDVFEGAFQLMAAVAAFPAGSVHLAVVDPGVGTERRGLAARLAGHTLVGPDNGLLSLALRRLAGRAGLQLAEATDLLLAGGPLEVVELAESRFWRLPVSPTFHARDIFGPVAAHLARGVPLADLGPAVDRLISLPWPAPELLGGGAVRGRVVHVDRFGNLTTNLPGETLPRGCQVRVGGTTIQGVQTTYGRGDRPVALIGSAGFLEIAMPGGSAAQRLALGRGGEVLVEPALGR